MDSSDLKYEWQSVVNVANFVTVKPSKEGGGKKIFKNWKQQMICLLESQEVVGFVDGEIVPPPEEEQQRKLWRRTDRLVKGWILGSVGRDVLDYVRDKETARDVWLQLDNIFKQQEEEEEEDDDDEKENNFSRYLPLYQAAMRGEWETAKKFLEDKNESGSTIIKIALHIAVSTGKANDLVNKLVEMVPCEALALKDSNGDTALHIAATVGNTQAAKALVNKNPNLLFVLNKYDRFPVQVAVTNCHRETLEYLISQHEVELKPELYKPLFEGQLGIRLFSGTISSEFVDVALDLARKHPNLAILKDNRDDDSALAIIARTGTLFPRTETFCWWKKFIFHHIPLQKSKCEADDPTTSAACDIESQCSNGIAHRKYSASFQIISRVGRKLESMIWYVIEQYLVPKAKELREKKARRQQALQFAEYLCDQIVSKLPANEALTIFKMSIKYAAEYGISEIVEMIIHKFPTVIFQTNDDSGRNVFQLAARYRYENVINLIYNMSDRRYIFFDSTDSGSNNLLHICGKLAPPHRLNLVAGAALQMQRELQWFKEMENLVHPSRRTWLNNEGQTPQMLFTQEHEKLKADGETWMKDTANACTIAAALIATVMFSAAFTVPGGVESATGVPLFTGDGAFELFAVSDAISMFTSITSLLIFLSILASRYAEEDFLCILPRRLGMGLLSLFVSIIFMLVAFSAAIYLLLETDSTWFLILVTSFACLPVTSFVLLQFPLLVDVVYSTYGPGIFGKKTNRILY